MLYKKIENKDLNKEIPIEYVGYMPAPFGPSKRPHVGFVRATDGDIRKEYDLMVEKQLREESNHVWNKEKGIWEIKK
ncbi:MAG: hypothetical protein KAW56_07985 [Candidatus Marinimicrobia bacterium]|nr:hypothetical protein [Candidatus Neomarinimicrobiota bacterium]